MKKKLLLLLLFITSSTFLAQEKVVVIKPVVKKTKTPIAKKSPAKTKKINIDKPSTVSIDPTKATIKFLCDATAFLYIDGEKKGTLKIDTPFRINLAQGEYIIKVVNPKDENDFIKWTYNVNDIGIEKLEEIRFNKSQGTTNQSSKKTQSKISPNKTDLEELKMLGKIKSITSNSYMVKIKKGKEQKGKLIFTLTEQFDEKGNKNESTFAKQKIIYNRNDQGKLITSFNHEAAEVPLMGISGFAGNARANSEKDKSLGKLISKTNYEYDNNNKLIGSSTYSNNGKLTSRSVMKRDGNGRLFENKTYGENNNLESIIIYDENEHVKELQNINTAGAVYIKALYTWNNNNNIGFEYYYDGKLTMKQTNTYDNKNQVIETATSNPLIDNNIGITTYSNEYDGVGNLIKKSSGLTIVETIIEYY
jgi:hypothetical protein